MSLGTEINTVLELMVDYVAVQFESGFDKHPEPKDGNDALKDIRRLLSSCKESPLHVIWGAAVSEMMYYIVNSAVADDQDFEAVLDVSKELLYCVVDRYARLDRRTYGQFVPLVNTSQVDALIRTWRGDGRPLGGNFSKGAISHPFERFVVAAVMLSRSVRLYEEFAKSMQWLIWRVLEAGGVNDPEDEFLLNRKHHFKKSREELMRALQPMDQKLDRPVTAPVALIKEETELPPDQVLAEAMAELKTLLVPGEVKAEIFRLANFLKIRKQRQQAGLPVPTQSLHFVFTGNPGTGKTTVARMLSRLLYGYRVLKTSKLVEADRASLVGEYVGHTAVKTSEVLEKAINGVLFIDEAYTLSKKDCGVDFGQEAIDTILKKMEDNRDKLVVIAAGYPELMSQFLASNPGLESRFTRFVEFVDYHVADLCQVFEQMCQTNSYSLTQDARANLAILFNRAYTQRKKTFGNARFVRNAYEQTLGNHADRLAKLDGDLSNDLLVTVEASDLPLNMVKGMEAPVDVASSKWAALCPACKMTHVGSITNLGTQVRCNCGKVFLFPAWNLDPVSIPSLKGFKVFNRPQDLMGLEVSEKLTVPVTKSQGRLS